MAGSSGRQAEEAPVLHLPQLSVSTATWDADLSSLLQHVRPQWQWQQVQQKLFTDGITNRLAALHLGSMRRGADVVLVRVYGEFTELIIDRQAEIRNMRLLHRHGLAPPLYATFANGLSYGFIHGQVAEEETVRAADTSRLIAKELAALHAVQPDGWEGRTPCAWRTMRRWLQLGPDEFKEPQRQRRLAEELPDKRQLAAEIDELERRLAPLGSPVVFCHNDTLIKNFVHCPEEDRVRLIDYEYCDFNYLAFDIGNHFNEFAGVDVVDHAKYPNKQFQLPWLRNYIRYSDQAAGLAACDDAQLEARVKQLYEHVNKFSLASHLFWSLWALVQARHSSIDFDFLDYGISRYSEYAAKKEERLAIKAADV